MMDIPTLVFYLLAFVTLFSALMVISARNPVHAVLFLILAFFNTAGLFILLGAEYLAMTLVIVYVGAVAILFLFVVMMLNINLSEMRQGFARHMPLGIGIALCLFIEMYLLFQAAAFQSFLAPPTAAKPAPLASEITNTEAIGNVLYTDYVYPFQLAGLILLVAMIGAIVLTLRRRGDVRKQSIGRQVARRRKEAIERVDIKPGSGI